MNWKCKKNSSSTNQLPIPFIILCTPPTDQQSVGTAVWLCSQNRFRTKNYPSSAPQISSENTRADPRDRQLADMCGLTRASLRFYWPCLFGVRCWLEWHGVLCGCINAWRSALLLVLVYTIGQHWQTILMIISKLFWLGLFWARMW